MKITLKLTLTLLAILTLPLTLPILLGTITTLFLLVGISGLYLSFRKTGGYNG